MAIFSSKKKTTEEKVVKAPKAVKAVKAIAPKKVATTKAVSTGVSNADLTVLTKPRVTEKAGLLSESNVYTFEVSTNANKFTITKAIKELYKVTPRKVNIINLPRRKVFVRGKFGVQTGVKKAMVSLNKGDKIEFI